MAVPAASRCACVVLAWLGFAAPAGAEPVVVLGDDGRARTVEDPFAGVREPHVPRSSIAPDSSALRATASAKKRTVRGELRRLALAGAITPDDHAARRGAYDAAKRTARRLSGVRRTQLAGAIGVLEDIAARRALTAARIPVLWLALERNLRWWTTGPLLVPNHRVQCAGF